MGHIALIVFLGSLALGFFSLFVLVWSGIQIYRTLRYAHKDSRPWLELFGEYTHDLREISKTMEERARNITDMGTEMRETVDDIHDAAEELKHGKLIKAARLAEKLRSS